ncbi:ABC transporter substrate-binding protein [Geodermatophilus marinus]|uniref:ABC transporter substrate-binding protein n=1 Tax=Geodermatophilus sp. LHW52908 TaxID=2303986 RepID=UPI000E3D4778|nr:ABC transporter substrate-binding protein [Geodermatophilus sp. LHW52908]RFU20161.1 ABC transporter substrate-binding protein [Geodermatophilus sp. LHW52908]
MHRRPRRLAGATLTLAAALAAAGCSGGPTGSAATGDGAGWQFTDDLGTTVELDEAPARVAGLNDVVASLWNYGVEPVAAFGQTSAADDVAFEGRDLSDLAIVGESYGQIDLERLAAADPDVIVTSVYPVDSSGSFDESQPLYGFESVEQQEQVAEIAPIIAIGYRGSAADVIERTVELADSLGADAGLVESARADFDAASARLTEAAASGITVLPVYATEADGWWMAKAPDDPALRLYSDLGVRFVDPGGEGYFWETVGWEEVPGYPSDVLLYSLRFSMTPEEIAAQPTAALLPAVGSGQLHPWKYVGMDYAAQAAYMEELAGWLESAADVTP